MLHIKRHIAIRFLFLAIGLLLAVHQTVPHHHHDEISEEEHVSEHASAHTFWEYLQLALHQELGNDDLTTTPSVEKSNVTVASFCIPQLFSFTPELTTLYLKTIFNNSEEISFKSHFYLLSNQFRAPPLV